MTSASFPSGSARTGRSFAPPSSPWLHRAALLVAIVTLGGCAQMGGALDSAKAASEKGLYKLGLSDSPNGSGSSAAKAPAGEKPAARTNLARAPATSTSAPAGGAATSDPVVDDAGARQLMSEFAENEVPHTLMRKPVAEGRLTSTFGFRKKPTGFLKGLMPKRHKGIDYGAPAGTPVFASGDGVIEKLYVSKSYGNFIRIKHSNGFRSAYAHMAAFFDGIKEGDFVARGQQIGTVGTTGRSTAPHLHYELTLNGQHVDPLF